MTQTQQTESAERIARPLIQLAKLNGISTSYIDQLGTYVEIRDEVLVSVLAALGVDASSDEAITASYAATQQRIADTLVEPTVVKFIGKEAVTPIRAKGNDVALKLTLEDGTEYAGDLTAYLTGSNADDGSLQLTLPDDIPAGYHTLAVDAGPPARRSRADLRTGTHRTAASSSGKATLGAGWHRCIPSVPLNPGAWATMAI